MTTPDNPIENKPIELIGEVALDLAAELSNAGTPEEQSLSKSGMGTDLFGRVGLENGKTTYQLIGHYQGRLNSRGYGLGLRVGSTSLAEENNNIFMPREGLGYSPHLLNPSFFDDPESKLGDFTFFLQGIQNDYPTINIPDEHVLFGGSLALQVSRIFFVGGDYRDSEIKYNATLFSENEEVDIVAPWRRVKVHTGFVAPLDEKHHLRMGYQVGAEQRGLMLRFPHGPFADYKGGLGKIQLGLGAEALFMRNILSQDYEIVWGLESYIEIPQQNLTFGAWIGNENPYDPNPRGGLRVTWQPKIKNFADFSVGNEFELIDTDEGIVRDLLTVGVRYPQKEKPPPVTEEDEAPTTDEKETSPHLIGDISLTVGFGLSYGELPLRRIPSSRTTFEPLNLGDIPRGCCGLDTIESLVNTGNTEQGPVNFTGIPPDVIGVPLMLSGNVYADKQRTAQIFWHLGVMPLPINRADIGLTEIDVGLGVAAPIKLGSDWALPVRLAFGGGLALPYYSDSNSDSNPDHDRGRGWFGQIDLLEKVWAGDYEVISWDLFFRGGQALLPISQTDSSELINYQVFGMEIELRDRINPSKPKKPRPVKPKPVIEEPKPVIEEPEPVVIVKREKRPLAHKPWSAEAEMERVETVEPVVRVEPVARVELVERIERELNSIHILFKHNEPRPEEDAAGFDVRIRDAKQAALIEKKQYNPDSVEEINQFLLDFEPEQFLMNKRYALLIIELAKSMKEILRDNPDDKIVISGHTNSVGSDQENDKLSANRAHLMMYYLILLGVDEDRLEVRAKGEGDLLFPEEEISEEYRDAAFEVNRRVLFRMVPIDAN